MAAMTLGADLGRRRASRAGRTSGAAVAGLILAAWPGAVPAEAPSDLALAYHVYAGGFHALSFQTEVNLGAEDYVVRLAARSNGLLDRLFRFTLDAEVSGRSTAANLAPSRFRTANRWRESEERLVEITYPKESGGGLPEVRVEPPPETDDRDLVPEGLRRDTLDPISALLTLVRAVSDSGRCEAEARVFDGRRRFDLESSHLGESELLSSAVAPFAGSTTRCRISFRPVTGFWRDERRGRPKSTEFDIFLAPVVAGGPLVPVRLEAQNRFGALKIHLVSARPAGSNLGLFP